MKCSGSRPGTSHWGGAEASNPGKDTRAWCRYSVPPSPPSPYNASPTMGYPAPARWVRIWCRAPLRITAATRGPVHRLHPAQGPDNGPAHGIRIVLGQKPGLAAAVHVQPSLEHGFSPEIRISPDQGQIALLNLPPVLPFPKTGFGPGPEGHQQQARGAVIEPGQQHGPAPRKQVPEPGLHAWPGLARDHGRVHVPGLEHRPEFLGNAHCNIFLSRFLNI